jgi:hypothetical protein
MSIKKQRRNCRRPPRHGSLAFVYRHLFKGFRCECGKWYRFPAYVFANRERVLNYTCDACGKKYEIFRGVANLFKEDEDEN